MAPSITTSAEWRKALNELPSTPDNIPSFFFGHGSPFLAFSESDGNSPKYSAMGAHGGPSGPLAAFLRDFGPALLDKYKPKAVVVFSAHWESYNERLVTDYGDENPLLMDYYGFQPYLYRLKFKSKGNSALSHRVVELFRESGQHARTTPVTEARGEDGRGFSGPGFDHGVFVPFRLMFGEESLEIPVVQVSIDSSMSPEVNWAVGEAIQRLRQEGALILSGGLTVHNLRDWSSFNPETAKPEHQAFDKAIIDAVLVHDEEERKAAMVNLTRHPGFRASHPREDHFVPLYVAAGAGKGGGVHVVTNLYGAPTIAFGV